MEQLVPISWKKLGGYPEVTFCAKHDRIVEPIVLTDAAGTSEWGCPYCAEEVLPQVTVKSMEPERPIGYFTFGGYQTTFFCPESKCNYRTNSGTALDMHKKFVHGSGNSVNDRTELAGMACSEAMCANDAVEFCTQCESAVCNDHMSYRNTCVVCATWPIMA